jgi:hypothetical protein
MHSRDTLLAVGRAAAPALRTQHEWIHRRVESISFPLAQSAIARRRISIDFTVPPTDAIPDGTSVRRHYVPLSILRKWPPMLRIDLRDGAGTPIPLLTAEQNAVVDGEVLVTMAQAIAADRLGSPDLGELEPLLRRVAEEPQHAASHALREVLPPRAKMPDDKLDALRHALRCDDAFVRIAGGLTSHTILWFRVQSEPGAREIAKFAYDVEFGVDLSWWEPPAFGLRPVTARYHSPHLGGWSSYHLLVEAPTPLRVIDTRLQLTPRPTVDSAVGPVHDPDIVATCCASRDTLRQKNRTLFSAVGAGRARFYVTGDRDGLEGDALVSMAVEKRGYVRGAAIAGATTAALISLFAVFLDEAASRREAAVAMLVFGPALLSYLLVRPSEHVLAASLLRGSRRVLLVIGGLPLASAAALIVERGEADALTCWFFVALAVLAWMLSLPLIIAAAPPGRRQRRPLSSV